MTKQESKLAIPIFHCTDSFLDSKRIIMHTEFRILEVRRGHVWAQPLDAVKQESLRIASASKYIENEVIVAERLSGGPKHRNIRPPESHADSTRQRSIPCRAASSTCAPTAGVLLWHSSCSILDATHFGARPTH